MNTQAKPVEAALIYPLSLAIFDYAPVLLTLAGQWLLLLSMPTPFATVYPYALGAALLMFCGGFLKATWKTIIAATARDIRWMEDALFLLLAPGASLFAWALWQARLQTTSADATTQPITVLIPLITSVVLIALSLPRRSQSKKWFLPLVALLTVSMGVIAANAAMLAAHFSRPLAATLFIASFVVSLLTAALSRRRATIGAQWLMEIANTAAALLFLLATLQLQNLIS